MRWRRYDMRKTGIVVGGVLLFLHMLGATVLVCKQEKQGAPPVWGIRVALPGVQEVIYQ